MAFFPRNPNERRYPGGSKHAADIIKNEGQPGLIMWKSPLEDFNDHSILVVAESEAALFYQDGTVQGEFTAGRYELTTSNYPFLGRLRNALTGGISSYHCEVYFVRLADTPEIRWGTDTPIQLRDPVLHIATSVQARGALQLRVEAPKLLLLKLAGVGKPMLDEQDLTAFVRNQMMERVKVIIAQGIAGTNAEILGIATRLSEFSQLIAPQVEALVSSYGLGLVSFAVQALDIPQDDPARKKLEEAFTDKSVMGILGDDWERQQQVDILKRMAENPGMGGFGAAGASFAMGNQMAGQFFSGTGAAGAAGGTGTAGAPFPKTTGAPGASGTSANFCPNCGTPHPAGARFCPNCGYRFA